MRHVSSRSQLMANGSLFQLRHIDYKQRRKKNAFTLVEMLVVTAIITVLVALLVPSLQEAKSYSKRTLCGSNVRAISQATLVYVASNDGRLAAGRVEQEFPANYANPMGRGSTVAILALLTDCSLDSNGKEIPAGYIPYNDGDSNTIYSVSGSASPYDRSNVKASKLLICPNAVPNIADGNGDYGREYASATFAEGRSATVVVQAGFEAVQIANPYIGSPANQRNWNGSDYTLVSSYLPNCWNNSAAQLIVDGRPITSMSPFAYYCPLAQVAYGWTSQTPQPASNITNPSDTWMFFEACYSGVPGTYPIFRHAGLSSTFSYLDGHVENLKPSNLSGGILAGSGVSFNPSNVANWDSRLTGGF